MTPKTEIWQVKFNKYHLQNGDVGCTAYTIGQLYMVGLVKFTPTKIELIKDCKVHGNHYTHLVKAKDEKRGVQIGNNHGHINGWTKNVYGKVTKILDK